MLVEQSAKSYAPAQWALQHGTWSPTVDGIPNTVIEAYKNDRRLTDDPVSPGELTHGCHLSGSSAIGCTRQVRRGRGAGGRSDLRCDR